MRSTTIDELAEIGIAPLNARSVVLSALLGSHPPRLPARALIALGEQFSIRPGTIRTSLSRMVANRELTVDNGRYELTSRLLERQREQDEGRRSPTSEWDGTWFTAIAKHDQRTVTERRSFRNSMTGSRLAELRPDIWLRPANTPGPTPSADVLLTRGPLECNDDHELVRRLWPVDEINRRAELIRQALIDHRPLIDQGGDDTLATAFTLAAGAVRFLRVEPQLPDELSPDSWTPPEIRPLYDEFAIAFQARLKDFFASVG